MPPECFDESPKYDDKLDIFSFGHLQSAAAVNQKSAILSADQKCYISEDVAEWPDASCQAP